MGSDTSVVPVMEACPEARDLGGFNLLADKAALGGEEASLAARRSRFKKEIIDPQNDLMIFLLQDAPSLP